MASTTSEAEQLVQKLYDPSYSAQANEIQERLQQLQKSQAGWQLAEELSNSADTSVRFFGALTFTVKLHQDGANLQEEQLQALQHKLLAWLIQLASKKEPLVVIAKLCSTIVTLFVLPSSKWRRCVQQIVCSFSAGELLTEEALVQLSSTETQLIKKALPYMDAWHMFMVLIFADTLADDAIRIDHSSQKHQYAHERVEGNMDDVIDVLQHAISNFHSQDSEYIHRMFQCFQSWIAYTQEEYLKSNSHIQRLRTLLKPAMEYLVHDATFESTAEFFTDVFTCFEDFASPEDLESFSGYIQHPTFVRYLEELEKGSAEPDPITFGLLMMAYGTAATKILVQAPDGSQNTMNVIHRVTRTQSHETVDQSLSNAIVDFWESFVLSQSPDVISDGAVQSSGSAAFVQSHWLQAVEELCHASRLEFDQTGEFLKAPSDEPLSEFRSRVRDAVQSSIEVYPLPVLNKLVMMVLRASQPTPENIAGNQTRAWDTLESALNCLVGIADALHYQLLDTDAEDQTLQLLFDSFLYEDLANSDVFIPIKIRRAAIYVVGEHHEFLQRHPQFLLAGLDVLFKCLEHPPLMETAAAAIYKLCDPNRSALNGIIDQFATSAEQFFNYPAADEASKESVSGAFAAVIQGLPGSMEQGRRTQQLLTMVENCFKAQLQLAEASPEREENRQTVVLTTLRQLRAIGRAFQKPSDAPIDLDSDEDAAAEASFWTSDEGKGVQAKIVQFVGYLLASAPSNEFILEAACDTIKSGYREVEPGPFVFPPQVTTDIVTAVPFTNPRVDLAVSAATALLMSSSSNPPKLDAALPPIVSYVCAVVKHLQAPSTDPEVASACIEFLSRLVTRWLRHFAALDGPAAELLLDFSLRALDGADVLPRRSAALLWSFLLSLRDEQARHVAPGFREQLVHAVGPRLARILVRAFAGGAARSDLDTLCEPFKKLVAFRFATPNLPKDWIEAALFDAGPVDAPRSGGAGLAAADPTASSACPSARGSDADKRRFVAQVLSLRGGARTNAVVKEFWLACRGVPVAYG